MGKRRVRLGAELDKKNHLPADLGKKIKKVLQRRKNRQHTKTDSIQ